jgi:hypothetical protein
LKFFDVGDTVVELYDEEENGYYVPPKFVGLVIESYDARVRVMWLGISGRLSQMGRKYRETASSDFYEFTSCRAVLTEKAVKRMYDTEHFLRREAYQRSVRGYY